MESNMFCYQCQETAGCTGCTRVGVCGKQPEVAALQDLLVYVTKGMSAVTTQLRAEGTPVDPETNHWVTLNLFLTITNANFDGPALRARVQDTLDRQAVRHQIAVFPVKLRVDHLRPERTGRLHQARQRPGAGGP